MIDTSRLDDETYRREVIDMAWQNHNVEIRQFCFAWLGSGLAEDMTQDVFVTAWQRLDKYRPEQPLRAWLYGIAHKKCQQTYRNRARRTAIANTFLEEIRDRSHTPNPTSPEQNSAGASELQRLQDAMARLSTEDRILMNLRYWRDLPMQEIISIVGKSAPTVRKRLRQAEQRLKEAMS